MKTNTGPLGSEMKRLWDVGIERIMTCYCLHILVAMWLTAVLHFLDEGNQSEFENDLKQTGILRDYI